MAGWRPELHPRDPRNGEFTDKPGDWVRSLLGTMPGRAPRRDLRDELSDQDYEDIYKTAGQPTHGGKPGDRMLDAIYTRQGFHAKPEVVSRQELDQAVAGGWRELWRGVKAGWHSDDEGLHSTPASDVAEQFRTGDRHYPGEGIFGNGSYAAQWRETALDFSNHESGGMIRMALPPDARVIEYGDVVDEWHKMSPGFDEHFRAAQEAAGVGPDDWVWGYSNLESTVLSDMGRLAAAMGYDAMVVTQNREYRPISSRGITMRGPGNEDYYIILNRGVLKVEEGH